MRNTISRRLLVPAVLLIWIVVTLRFMDGCNTNVVHSVSESQNFLTFHSSVVPDTFSLGLNYQDPFLRDIESPSYKRLSSNSVSYSPIKTNFTPPLLQLPEIQFLGGIKGRNKQKMTGVIMIDGKSFSVKTGDVIDEVLIRDIKFEALTVSFNDSTYQITI